MNNTELIEKLRKTPVIPVLDPKSESEVIAAVEALVMGGAGVIEITLRSEIAFRVFPQLREQFPNIVIGAGSVMDEQTYDKAVELGADFTISPGRCIQLEQYTKDKGVAHIPGCVTPTEIIAARQAGQKLIKFYPSEASGGAATLKDLGRIFPDVFMMPSGGIKKSMLKSYAAVPTVVSVGGSWMYAENGQYLDKESMIQAMSDSIEAMLG